MNWIVIFMFLTGCADTGEAGRHKHLRKHHPTPAPHHETSMQKAIGKTLQDTNNQPKGQ